MLFIHSPKLQVFISFHQGIARIIIGFCIQQNIHGKGLGASVNHGIFFTGGTDHCGIIPHRNIFKDCSTFLTEHIIFENIGPRTNFRHLSGFGYLQSCRSRTGADLLYGDSRLPNSFCQFFHQLSFLFCCYDLVLGRLILIYQTFKGINSRQLQIGKPVQLFGQLHSLFPYYSGPFSPGVYFHPDFQTDSCFFSRLVQRKGTFHTVHSQNHPR